MKFPIRKRFAVLLTPLLLTACFSLGGGKEKQPVDSQQPRFYVMDVDRGSVSTQQAVERILYLTDVSVSPQFAGNTLMLRVGDNEYAAQTGHEFIIDPQTMLTSQLERWLQKTGLFSRVIRQPSDSADMVMDVTLTALYGEKRQQFSPEAVIEMQFFLSSNTESARRLLFQTGFRVEVDIDETTPGKTVTGLQHGLEEILVALEQDLSDYFSRVDAP